MRKGYVALKPFNNKIFYKNRIFNGNPDSSPSFFVEVKKLLNENNISIETIDIQNKSTLCDIYLDIPYPFQLNLWFRIIKNREKNILFLWEPPLVNPFNYMRIFKLPFKKIYTWNKKLIDNNKILQFYLPKRSHGIKQKKLPFNKKRLLLLMNSNWLPFKPFQLLTNTKELYSERIRAIKFFDMYHHEEFDLYGRGWNRPHKFSLFQYIFGYPIYRTYRGSFPSDKKNKIISQYKFTLCFENSQENGYISEKIFDCFKAKSVPIYLGAPNIQDFIPKSCYIDFRDFDNYEQLYNYIKSMRENIYNSYILSIEKLLQSKTFTEKWFEKGFANLFLKAIIN